MDISLTPTVLSVTVYTEQARVTARGQATLTVGSHRLVVEDLPLTMDRDSVRVDGQSMADAEGLVEGADDELAELRADSILRKHRPQKSVILRKQSRDWKMICMP